MKNPSPTVPYEAIRSGAPLPAAMKDLLPRRWEKVGDVLILRFPPALHPYRQEICEAYADVLGVKAVLDRRDGIHGPWRTPTLGLLWGSETETIHREDGIQYRLDPRKVMFSSGNLRERMRMGTLCDHDETVVDMFAGIGYFTLPMAVHGHARRIVACEVNPTAFRYLQENVCLNRAEAVEPLRGDCREVVPDRVADRIVLGYLRATERFLPKALRVLRERGWIHYHEACPDRVEARPRRHVRKAARVAGRTVERLRQRRVKAYAPGVSHWVVDAYLT